MKKNKVKTGTVIYYIFNLLTGIALGIMLVNKSGMLAYLENDDLVGYILSFVFYLFVTVIAFFLQLILHEGGHLLFGLLSGYSFKSFRILDRMIIRKESGYEFKKFSLAGTAGQCIMCPPQLKDGKIPYVLYNLGGVLMNLIVSAISIAAAVLIETGGGRAVFFWIMALIGIYMMVANGVPYDGTVPNDGYNALNLGRNPDAVRAFWVQLMVNVNSADGVRICDMPQEWFQIAPDADLKNKLITTQMVLCENRAMDLRDFEKANELIDTLLSEDCGLIEIYRVLLLGDRAFLDMLKNGRDADVSALHDQKNAKLLKQLSSQLSVMRTSYAEALLVDGDREKAAKVMEEFDMIAKNYPSESDVQSERELMALADTSFEAR